MRFSCIKSLSCVTGTGALTAGLLLAAMAMARAVPLPDINPERERQAGPAQPAAQPAPSSAAPAEPPPPETRPDPETVFNWSEALSPLTGFNLSKADRDNLKTAVRSVYSERFADARAAMKRIGNEHARKVARWYYYRSDGLDAKAGTIEAFRTANPEWPSQDRLRRNAERALFLQRADAETVRAFFAESAPRTGAGKAAQAAMHLAADDTDKARALLAEAWRDPALAEEVEEAILERHSQLLDAADHKARADRLLYKDRTSRIPAVERVARLLPEAERKKVEARIAVVRRSDTAGKLLKAIPENHARGDTGFYFSRIQWHRRQDAPEKNERAWTLLREAPTEPGRLLDLGEWWIERRVNCYSALNAGRPEIAYEIASEHGPITGSDYAEAEFLAGWIALRFLGRIEAAEKHFLALRTSARTPKVIARAEYWLGRTAEARGDRIEAVRRYANAGERVFTYYGQLARQALSRKPDSLPVADAPMPAPEDVARFGKRDAVMAIAVLQEADLANLAPLFFHHLARTLASPGEVALLAELGRALDQPHASVRLGKIAFNRGLPMAEYAFPIGLLPDYKKLNDPVDEAFLHALSRQESEFNPEARSPAGARGLMQLMPGTARMVARQHRVAYQPSRLTGDPAYNVMLGAAHLRDLLDKYDGSYIISLAAYNAGPGRAAEWIERFGDPRDPGVDPVDWVERVPFTETRNYIRKILTTMQIFRARLDGPEGALRLWQDLHSPEGAESAAVAAESDANTTSPTANN